MEAAAAAAGEQKLRAEELVAHAASARTQADEAWLSSLEADATLETSLVALENASRPGTAESVLSSGGSFLDSEPLSRRGTLSGGGAGAGPQGALVGAAPADEPTAPRLLGRLTLSGEGADGFPSEPTVLAMGNAGASAAQTLEDVSLEITCSIDWTTRQQAPVVGDEALAARAVQFTADAFDAPTRPSQGRRRLPADPAKEGAMQGNMQVVATQAVGLTGARWCVETSRF